LLFSGCRQKGSIFCGCFNDEGFAYGFEVKKRAKK
jgi:hypothetical protein